MSTLHVLSVASEAVPLVKTGGLADVVGALPAALAPHGVTLSTLLPGYPAVKAGLSTPKTLLTYARLFGEPARVLEGRLGEQPLLVLDAPGLFARDGGPYTDAAGQDWPDNWRRFAALSRVAADLAGGAVAGKRFDLLHAHDWQAAMAPAYLRLAPPPGVTPIPSVMTIHNIAFQGAFDADIFPALGLPDSAWSLEGVEYYGGVGFLKAGLAAASAVTTVSPTYAEQIRRPEFGMGLEGLIAARGGAVHGIVNGIDGTQWRPDHDGALVSRFSARSLRRRVPNKRALEAEFGLERSDGPLFIAITRLTWQKGSDVLAEVLDHLVRVGGRLALLGTGDPALESALLAAADRHPGRIAIRIGYDEALSHRMQGGGDAILIPSRFEPCGLTQLMGLAYGCVPVVARTGGLADTIIDTNLAALQAGVATGIQFEHVDHVSLAAAITRTAAFYRDTANWRILQRNGMNHDFSWGPSGKAYADLYADLTEA